jgi:NADH-quinone oxidoreductase subunit N
MSGVDAILLLPFLIVGATAIAVMLTIAFRRSAPVCFIITVAGFISALVSAIAIAGLAPARVVALLMIDRYALFYEGLLLICSTAVAVLAWFYFSAKEVWREEFFILLPLATLGAMILSASNHFVSFFLGLELLSVSLYPLIAYRRVKARSLEAGIKYLVSASVASAFLLFGMALIYADRGSMDFTRIVAPAQTPESMLIIIGLLMIMVGIGFKLALVPFHWWAPDVYQGAPAPVAAYVATVSKTAVLALFMRLYLPVAASSDHVVNFIVWGMAIASMFIGNLLALYQENVKRIIAYSSIAHMGYFMVAFLGATRLGIIAATYYIVAYVFTILGAFGVIIFFSREEDAEAIDDFRNLAAVRAVPAMVLTLCLLSLAGIPFTAGFMGKFFVLSAGVQNNAWPLAASLVVSSAIGLFYYLRIIMALYQPGVPSSRFSAPAAAPQKLINNIVLGAAALAILWIGIVPGPLFNLLRWMLAR